MSDGIEIVFNPLVCIFRGKADLSISNTWFNIQTCKLYQDLTDAEREELTAQIDPSVLMTSAEVKKRARRITLNIESKVLTKKLFVLSFVDTTLYFSSQNLNP